MSQPRGATTGRRTAGRVPPLATGPDPTSRARLAGAARGADQPLNPAGQLAADWAPVVARVLLGLVLAWFGYHELVQPGLWTGYVPVVSATSDLAVVLVLAHGYLLLLLAVALLAGILPRLAAAVAAAALLEIVIALAVTGGLSDLTMRDVGVLGLAICLTGVPSHRFALRR